LIAALPQALKNLKKSFAGAAPDLPAAH